MSTFAGMPPTNPELLALLKIAAAHTMTPAEIAKQRRNYVIGEAGMGSDADEAAYRVAMETGDNEALAKLDAEAKARQDQARAWLAANGL